VGSVDDNVTVTLYPAGGGSTWSTNFDLSEGETGTINLLNAGIAEEWVGSAVIASDVHLVALAERVKAETYMLIINASTPVDDEILVEPIGLEAASATTRFAPLVFKNFHHWNTGISIANLADVGNEVTITYYHVGGTEAESVNLTIPPKSMDFVYTPAISDDPADIFIGSAVVTGTHPIAGVVDEVKYLGNDLDTGHAMSYTLLSKPAMLDEALLQPLAQRGTFATGMGDTSGIQIFNPTDESVTVAVMLFSQGGNEPVVPPTVRIIGPRASYNYYLFEVDGVPDGFQGSVIVAVTEGSGGVVAMSNSVNYAV
jgi:hypothetical protein